MVIYYQQFGVLTVESNQYKCGVYPQSADKIKMHDRDKLMYALKTCPQLLAGFNEEVEFSLAHDENIGIYNFPGTDCNIYVIDGDVYDYNFIFQSVRSTELPIPSS